MGDTGIGKDCACMGAGGVWEISVPSLNFAMNLKLLHKVKSIFFKRFMQKSYCSYYIWV